MATKSTSLTIDINGVCVPQLTEDPSTWKGASLLSVRQITPGGFRLLWSETKRLAQQVHTHGVVASSDCANRLVATVFYEASTRTSCSFQAASLRLGAKFLHVDSSSSSTKKGESLSDTLRCIACYVDAIVLRHPVQGSVGQVVGSPGWTVPILNAGDGVGEHPTQALLDVYTMCQELGLDDAETPPATLTIVIVGDLRHGRTVHSLVPLLAAQRGVVWRDALVVRYCAPSTELGIPESVETAVAAYEGVHQETVTTTPLAAVITDANVLYVTRVQKERFATEEEYAAVKGSYVVNNKTLSSAPRNMVILHPLPRVDEIATEVDADPRAAYFRQMENGMHVRMALLNLILSSFRED